MIMEMSVDHIGEESTASMRSAPTTMMAKQRLEDRKQIRNSFHRDLTITRKSLAKQSVAWLCVAITLSLSILACALVAMGSPMRQIRRDNKLVNLIPHREHHHDEHNLEFEHRTPASYHQLTSQDLASADQLDDPTFLSSMGDEVGSVSSLRSSSANDGRDGDDDDEPILVDNFSEFSASSRARRRRGGPMSRANAFHSPPISTSSDETTVNREESTDGPNQAQDSQEDTTPERSVFQMNQENDHNNQLRAMRDIFERRQMSGGGVGGHHNQHHHQRPHRSGTSHQNGQPQLQPNSQELSPISIGLDPPFAMPSPFQMGDGAAPPPPPPLVKPQMGADSDGGPGGPLGGFPFGANPLPHLLGFQNAPFDGPQRGDQSAHSNHHAAAAPGVDVDGGGPSSPKVWPKIFRFTDGRINLSDFEKQKKIRLSSKNQHGENHIESAPIMFDNRQLKRKSFLILHGGVFQAR